MHKGQILLWPRAEVMGKSEMQGVHPEYQEMLFFCKDNWWLAQVAQGHCEEILSWRYRDTQKPSRHHWAAHYSCHFLSREIDLDNLQGTLPTSINPLFCDSVYLDTFFLTAGFLHLCEKFCLTNSLCSMSREKSLKYANNIHPELSRFLFHPDNDSGDLDPTLILGFFSEIQHLTHI